MSNSSEKWLAGLSGEDLTFIKRFVLASGSLKQLAEVYGVTYPTIRLRLDRLIDKIEVLDNETITDEFERTIRSEYAEGRIDNNTMKTLLAAHQKTLEEKN